MNRFNWQIWIAAPLGVATFVSYPLVFARWPITRDVPWVNGLMFVLTGLLMFSGIRRAFARGRGVLSKVAAVPLAALTLFGLSSFVMAFVLPQHLTSSQRAPRIGQRAPEFTLADTDNRSVSLADLLSSPVNGRAPKAVLLIFQMGHGCHACSSELRDMQRHLDALYQAGVRPVAISNDAPDVSRRLAREAGYTFTFLSDPHGKAIKRFDLLDPDEGDAARPAEFLVDIQGIVRWRMLTDSIYVRARPAQILAAAKTLQ